jgi:capsular polysaccharide biosynthesis protein
MQEQMQGNENGMTLVEFFNLIIKNILLIVTITVATTVISVVYTYNIAKPTYTAQTKIIVQVMKGLDNESTNDYDLNTTKNLMATVSEFIQQDMIIEAVIEDLDLNITTSTLRNNLTVSYNSSSLLISVKYESLDPETSADVVNSVVENTISIANEEYPILNNTMKSMGIAKKGIYSSPNKVLNIAIGVILGGILGVVMVLLVEVFHTTVRNKKELEVLLPNYQVIGVIPDIVTEEE